MDTPGFTLKCFNCQFAVLFDYLSHKAFLASVFSCILSSQLSVMYGFTMLKLELFTFHYAKLGKCKTLYSDVLHMLQNICFNDAKRCYIILCCFFFTSVNVWFLVCLNPWWANKELNGLYQGKGKGRWSLQAERTEDKFEEKRDQEVRNEGSSHPATEWE